MSLAPSSMLPLGEVAPEFNLLDTVSDQKKTLEELKGKKGTVIMFICNHCPYVKHVQPEIIKLANEYQPKGIGFVAISANDVSSYPADGPDKMKEVAEQLHYPFPYLYDKSQDIAKRYRAECTPDFYLFESNLKCVYRGQLDDSRPNERIPLTGEDLRQAMDNLLDGQPINPNQKPSIGCNIKWM